MEWLWVQKRKQTALQIITGAPPQQPWCEDMIRNTPDLESMTVSLQPCSLQIPDLCNYAVGCYFKLVHLGAVGNAARDNCNTYWWTHCKRALFEKEFTDSLLCTWHPFRSRGSAINKMDKGLYLYWINTFVGGATNKIKRNSTLGSGKFCE